MKKILFSILLFLILGTGISVPVSAEENNFYFELMADGKQEKEVKHGDIITVVLRLKRTDSLEPYMMYAMQDEIRYDSTFFELVEGSEMLSEGIAKTDIAMVDRDREFYMNYLSMSGGNKWDADTLVGSFQLRVIGESGVSRITSQDYLVSVRDGSESYPCEGNELTIIISTECIVHFMTNGGMEIEDQIVQYGEKIIRPDDPKRKGYRLEGWYKDIHLTEKWDFDNDTVKNNMSLYAKWVEVENSCSWIYWIFILVILVLIYFYRKKRKTEKICK